MSHKLLGTVCLAACIFLGSRSFAQSIKAVETGPANDATVESLATGFYVRFDEPVDHIQSRLYVRQGDKTVATLQPRFKAEPNVLFAQAPELAPGSYRLHWSVRRLDGSDVVEGEIAFILNKKK